MVQLDWPIVWSFNLDWGVLITTISNLRMVFFFKSHCGLIFLGIRIILTTWVLVLLCWPLCQDRHCACWIWWSYISIFYMVSFKMTIWFFLASCLSYLNLESVLLSAHYLITLNVVRRLELWWGSLVGLLILLGTVLSCPLMLRREASLYCWAHLRSLVMM